MIKKVVKGDFYAVATESECVVTSATGKPLGTATAGNPVTFPATTDEVEISDPDADFVRVNPNSAPAKLMLYGLLGRGKIDVIPAGYIAAEFLENHAPVALRVPVNKPLAGFSFEQCHAYASDETGGEAAETSGTSMRVQIGEWNRANLFVWVVRSQAGGSYLPDTKKTMRVDVDAGGAKIYLDNAFLFEQTGEMAGTVTAFNLFSRNYSECFAGKKYWVKMRHNGEIIRDLVPCISPDGKTAFYDRVSKKHYAASKTESYIAGMTCKQALKLAELPAGGGELTVSLPWEAQLVQHNAEVEAALQAAKSNGWTITVQYRDAEPDNAVYNKYAECVTVADMQAVNADYKNDLTAAGEWLYPLPKLTNALQAFLFSNLRFFNVPELPEATNLGDTFNGSKLERIKLNVPKSAGLTGTFYNAKSLKWAEVQLKNQYPTNLVGSFRQCTSLTHVRINLDHINGSGWLFENCQLDKESTLHILTQLRTFTSGTHEISIGIHVDNQNDEEVLAAISEAEAKMWTLSVQWTGTATAQVATYGLRRPAIYAKVCTMVLPDGTTEQHLDWGHYVTNWEVNGYQEFSSLEEAKEYFNISE